MQAANSWQTLGRTHQHDDESSLKCHQRFMAAVEQTEDVCKKIEADELTIRIATKCGEEKEGQD